MNTEELLAKAKKPSADAMRLHPFYRGKIETTLKCTVHSFDDFAIWYTPGVAATCKAIQADPELVYEYTNKWNTVAGQRWNARAGSGRHRSQSRSARHGRQSPAVQIFGRRGRRPHHARHQRPGCYHQYRIDAPARAGRCQSRRYIQPKVLLHPRYPARESGDPHLARRPARHCHCYPGGTHQRPQSCR